MNGLLFHLLNMEIYWGEIKNQFFLTIDPNFLGHPSGSSVNTSDRSESKCKIEMNDSMMHERRYCIIYIYKVIQNRRNSYF